MRSCERPADDLVQHIVKKLIIHSPVVPSEPALTVTSQANMKEGKCNAKEARLKSITQVNSKSGM